MMNPNEAQKELDSLRRQLAEERENLRLIHERKSEYVRKTEVPLDLIKDKRRCEAKIAELEKKIAELEAKSTQGGQTPKRIPTPTGNLDTVILQSLHNYV